MDEVQHIYNAESLRSLSSKAQAQYRTLDSADAPL